MTNQFENLFDGHLTSGQLVPKLPVPYVEAVREINRIQGGVVRSSQPVSLPQPRAEPEVPRTFTLPEVDLDAQRYVTGDAAHGNAVLDGAVYDLYAAEDITHPDGVTGVVDYHHQALKPLCESHHSVGNIITVPPGINPRATVASIKVLFRGIKASIHTRFALSHAHGLAILHYREHYPA